MEKLRKSKTQHADWLHLGLKLTLHRGLTLPQ